MPTILNLTQGIRVAPGTLSMNTQTYIVLNLIILATVLSHPVIYIQTHQHLMMSIFSDKARQNSLLTQTKQLDEPPLNPDSPDERIPAGTHKSDSLAFVQTRKGLVKVEDEPTPLKEDRSGGSRWITI